MGLDSGLDRSQFLEQMGLGDLEGAAKLYESVVESPEREARRAFFG